MELGEVFWKLHEGLPKQGAGSDASTRRALAMVPELRAEPRILDLGCGPGRQSLVLAADTGGHVTAVDVLEPFLRDLTERTKAAGLTGRITPLLANMTEVGDKVDGGFDLIWCEGAIYFVGFEKGLRTWRQWLAPGGTLVVSELCWLGEDRPQEAVDFWREGYPAMTSLDETIEIASRAGFEVLESFVLPLSDWTVDYYDVIADRIAQLREERGDEPEVASVLDAEDRERELLLRHHESFGYVFLIMRPR